VLNTNTFNEIDDQFALPHALLFKTVDAFMPVEEHIKTAGQRGEWFVREEHFHGGFNF
jgi:hypothetical protein